MSEEVIYLNLENGRIEGTLLLADEKKLTPVVLIIAGSGPTDRDGNNPNLKNNSLKMLAEGLARNGISSLRYDKRGVGASQIADLQEIDLRIDHYMRDARAWIKQLVQDDRFSDVIVLGHSEGALIGMVAIQGTKANKMIAVAGIASKATEVLKTQLSAQPPEVINASLPIIASLEKGQLIEDIPPLLAALFRPSVQPYLISLFQYNPVKEIAKLDLPILIIQGTTDLQVGVTEAEKLHQACEAATLCIIPGMNHILKAAVAEREKNLVTYWNPDLPLKEELIPAIIEFLK